MRFHWKNLGFVFTPDQTNEKLYSHTTPISPLELENCIRIFYSPRTKPDLSGNSISYISFIDLDKDNPRTVLNRRDEVLLPLGGKGDFDEHGTMVAEVVRHNQDIYLYYMGWQRNDFGDIPYKVKVGLAISTDNGNTFTKFNANPIVSVDDIDPISIGNITILIEKSIWRMWYTSYTRWEFKGVKPTPEYEIKYATSTDGIHWTKSGIVCIEEDEYGGVATPTIWKRGEADFFMWFGYRRPYEEDGKVGKYKLGFANSKNGLNWQKRYAETNILASGEEWDSQMMCYPAVIKLKDVLYMFYCGNEFGKSGFGVLYHDLNNES
jgi:hypothetical protein